MDGKIKMVDSLRAQTSAASYAMSQQGRAQALKSYYGALLENPNVQRGLATIKATEGTTKNGYATAFGGGKLPSLDTHPGKTYSFKETTGKKNKTTAAGAYQFLSRTWKSMASKLGLNDFGPLSQDIAALGLIDQAGGLKALIAGDIKGFVSKVNGVWASLPGAPYAQPTKSWGFVDKAWNNALNPATTAISTPTSATGGLFSSSLTAAPQGFTPQSTPLSRPAPSPSLTAAPIGRVTRSPLGPASLAPDRAMPSGPISVGNLGSLPPDRTMPSGPVKSAPSLAPDRAMPVGPMSLANLAKPTAPKVSAPTSAVTGMLSSALTAAPQSFTPQAAPLAPPTIGMLARPALAPVPAAAVPAPAVAVARVAPPTPSYSRQAVAPARPSLSTADVYGGAVGTAQTSTPGTTVSRATSYGPTYTTNKFGAVTAVAPDGTQMAAWGGVPAAKPAISGPLSQTGITTPAPTNGMFGPKAKAVTGTVAGAAIGGYALGPLGAMLGGLIGKNVAAGKAPLSGLLGGSNNANTHMVDTFQGQMKFANAQGGLGFPSAPSNPGGLKANSTNNSSAGMRGISPGAANAIDHGVGGLY